MKNSKFKKSTFQPFASDGRSLATCRAVAWRRRVGYPTSGAFRPFYILHFAFLIGLFAFALNLMRQICYRLFAIGYPTASPPLLPFLIFNSPFLIGLSAFALNQLRQLCYRLFAIGYPTTARAPLPFLIFNFAFIIGASVPAQLPSTNLPPSTEAVMVNTNGALVNPTNFFRANSNALNSSVSGLTSALNPGKIFVGSASSNAAAQTLSGDANLATNGALTLSNSATARNNLGLGSIATVNSPVPIASGGTGATTAATAAVSVGTQFISDTDVPVSTSHSAGYTGQIAITHDGYWYWANSTSAGDWKGSAGFIHGLLQIGDSSLMPYVPGGYPPMNWFVNGNLQNQTNPPTGGNGNVSFFNMNPWGYSGLICAYVKQGSTATNASVVDDPAALTVFMGGSKAGEGIAGVGGIAIDPTYVFGVLCPFNLGGETNFAHLVEAYTTTDHIWHWPKPVANVCSPTNGSNIDAMKLDTTGGNLTVLSNVTAKGVIISGSGNVQLTLPGGGLNAGAITAFSVSAGAIDDSTTLKITKIIPHFFTTAAAPLLDVGNNGTGLYFPSSDSSLSVAMAGTQIGKWDTAGNLINFNSEAVGTSSAPATCAVLDLTSTSKGLLLPRMTKSQRNAISSIVAGLAVYQTDNTPGLRMYNGSHWVRFTETNDD